MPENDPTYRKEIGRYGICLLCGTKKCGRWHFKIGAQYIPVSTDDEKFLRRMDRKLQAFSEIDVERDDFDHDKCHYQAKLLRNAFRAGYVAAAKDARKLVKYRKSEKEAQLLKDRATPN